MKQHSSLRARVLYCGTAIAVLGVILVSRLGIGFTSGILLGVLVGALAVVGGMFFLATRVQHAGALRPARPSRRDTWDYAMELRALDGRYVYATSFKGRVVFMNFWATWCAPCIAETPSIERLASTFSDTDAVFACVTSEPLDRVKAFVAKRNLRIPIFLIEGDRPPEFESRSIPATFIVDRAGTIAFQQLGAARWDSPESVSFLRQLVAGAATAVSSKDQLEWERSLPEIVSPWTHWRLLGDGKVLGDVSVNEMTRAIDIVRDNVAMFESIDARRIAIDSNGTCVRTDDVLFAIAPCES